MRTIFFPTLHIVTKQQSPSDVLDYTGKWMQWLDGDTISTSAWSTDNGLTLSSESNNTDSATVFISGGSDGNTYKVTNQITTTAGRTKEGFIFIKVVEPEAQKVRDYGFNA